MAFGGGRKTVPSLRVTLKNIVALVLSFTGDFMRGLKTPPGQSEERSTAATGAADPVRLEIRAPNTLVEGDAQGMYDLLKANMHDMYVEAGWGWNEAEKWREMRHRDARFLIARFCCDDGDGAGGGEEDVAAALTTSEGQCLAEGKGESDAGVTTAPAGGLGTAEQEAVDSTSDLGEGGSATVAFAGASSPLGAGGALAKDDMGGQRLAGYCHFRFAWDQDENEDGEGVGGTEDVLYVYELQVAPWAKRRGLGRRMMQALEVRYLAFGGRRCVKEVCAGGAVYMGCVLLYEQDGVFLLLFGLGGMSFDCDWHVCFAHLLCCCSSTRFRVSSFCVCVCRVYHSDGTYARYCSFVVWHTSTTLLCGLWKCRFSWFPVPTRPEGITKRSKGGKRHVCHVGETHCCAEMVDGNIWIERRVPSRKRRYPGVGNLNLRECAIARYPCC